MVRTFVCFGDTHGAPLPSSVPAADACLHAGDLYEHLDGRTRPAPGGEDAGVRRLKTWLCGPRLLAVRGNHDCADPANVFAAADITGKREAVGDGLVIIGIGWHGEVFSDLPTERDLREAIDRIPRTSDSSERIVLLTHYPPRGDREDPRLGVGFGAIDRAIEILQPVAVVAGHLHLPRPAVLHLGRRGRGTVPLGVTPVLFPGPGGLLLEIDGTEPRVRELD